MSTEASPKPDLGLNPRTTALVLIDLQRAVMLMPTAPHPSSHVVAHAAALADRFRSLGSPVVLVTVDFRADGADRLSQPTDAPPRPPMPPMADASSVVPELKPNADDLYIVKKQWGAFYGTNLDLQLRRRGIDTIVLGGIATNFGVESTGRAAWEHNYKVVFVEDAMASMAAEAHEFAVSTIFPRLGRVRSTAEVLADWK
jgi:nicotinamidase-related amidase